MLDVKQNTLDYGSLLMPPNGYFLKRAVATTYSLDLNALLAIPVALYYSKPLETDFEKNPNPYDVLNSISQANKSVTVFCQRGKILVPKYNRLLGLTQDCIVEIAPPVLYSSFHPKCWWLLFEDKRSKKQTMRFAIMSRNLTFDRSWDIAFTMEGSVSKEILDSNRPMLHMIEYLEKISSFKIEQSFKQAILTTNFELENPFINWRFFPIGISDDYKNPIESQSYRYDEILVMSPFVDDTTVNQLSLKSTDKAWFFARRNELDQLNLDTLSNIDNAYCIKDTVVNGEMDETKAEDIPNADPQHLDLHAKLYISKKGETNTWLLGSANCTIPAIKRNIECLIELKSKSYETSPSFILKQLVSNNKEEKLFDVYERFKEASSEKDDLEHLIRKLECDLIGCKLTASLVKYEDAALYSYEANYDLKELAIPASLKLFLKPFYENLSADPGHQLKGQQENIITFDAKLKESLLSKFFMVSIVYKDEIVKQFLIKAEVEMPETWNSKILAEILESTEKFLQYFRFLISENALFEPSESPVNGDKSRTGNSLPGSIYNIPIFEELMHTASRNEERLKSIKDLFEKLQLNEDTRKLIPQELLEVWNHFSQLIITNEKQK